MNEKFSPRQKRLGLEKRDDELLVIDVVRYLSDLARLHSNEKTGNDALSQGLRDVSKALRPYGQYHTSDLIDLTGHPARSGPTRRDSSNSRYRLPDDLETMSHGDVERVLDDLRYTKVELVKLGADRFGISRSKLARLAKVEAANAIRAALAHEKTLDLISQEASRSGVVRTN